MSEADLQRVNRFIPFAVKLISEALALREAPESQRLEKAQGLLELLRTDQNREDLQWAFTQLDQIKNNIPTALHGFRTKRDKDKTQMAINLLKVLQQTGTAPPSGESVATTLEVKENRSEFIKEYDQTVRELSKQKDLTQRQQRFALWGWIVNAFYGSVENPWYGAFVLLVLIWTVRKAYELTLHWREAVARFVSPGQFEELTFFGWRPAGRKRGTKGGVQTIVNVIPQGKRARTGRSPSPKVEETDEWE